MSMTLSKNKKIIYVVILILVFYIFLIYSEEELLLLNDTNFLNFYTYIGDRGCYVLNLKIFLKDVILSSIFMNKKNYLVSNMLLNNNFNYISEKEMYIYLNNYICHIELHDLYNEILLNNVYNFECKEMYLRNEVLKMFFFELNYSDYFYIFNIVINDMKFFSDMDFFNLNYEMLNRSFLYYNDVGMLNFKVGDVSRSDFFIENDVCDNFFLLKLLENINIIKDNVILSLVRNIDFF